MIALKILVMVCITSLVVAVVAYTLFWVGRQAYRTFSGWEDDKAELLSIYEMTKKERNTR